MDFVAQHYILNRMRKKEVVVDFNLLQKGKFLKLWCAFVFTTHPLVQRSFHKEPPRKMYVSMGLYSRSLLSHLTIYLVIQIGFFDPKKQGQELIST